MRSERINRFSRDAKHFLLGFAILGSILGAAEAAPVCHLDAESGWVLLEVKSSKQYDKHIAHGDGVPGGQVPGDDTALFDSQCVVIPGPGFIYAVAYIDMDPIDGGYNKDVDQPIAELIEASGNSELGRDDVVITYRYPDSVDDNPASAPFTQTTHTCSDFTFKDGERAVCYLSFPLEAIEFLHSPLVEKYRETRLDGNFYSSFIEDFWGGDQLDQLQRTLQDLSCYPTSESEFDVCFPGVGELLFNFYARDYLLIDPDSPSRPSGSVCSDPTFCLPLGSFDQRDNQFVDVEIR